MLTNAYDTPHVRGDAEKLNLFRNSRKLTAILPIALVAFMALSLVPVTHAYGKANWQVGLAGTGVFPTGGSFGFWGWCAFVGVSSGGDGDCQVSQYLHLVGIFTGTCEESFSITSWAGTGGTFVISGTVTVVPVSQTAFCLSFFPGSATFTGVDTGIPSAAGHCNFGALFGSPRGEFQIQVTQIS